MKHGPYTDDGVTYCGWDGHEGCGEMWPCATQQRDDALAALAVIVRTCDNLLFAVDQGSFNAGDDWLRHDFGYLQGIARAALEPTK